MWETLGNKPSIFGQKWPVWDEEIAKEEEIELVVQVNGKVRSKAMVKAGLSDEETADYALSLPKIQEATKGKEIRKKIVVRGKLVNIVVGK